MGVFLAGTTLAAVAPVFEVLLVGRVVQAAGTAVMMPLLMTTLMSVVPEQDRGRVMGNVTLAMSVAPALGPAVSGVILEYLSWRWMFGLVLPVACTTRATSRTANVGASAASNVPAQNTAVASPNACRVVTRCRNQPVTGITTARVSMNAVESHCAARALTSNSPISAGSALTMIVSFRMTMKVASTSQRSTP
jgi:MFS family permease